MLVIKGGVEYRPAKKQRKLSGKNGYPASQVFSRKDTSIQLFHFSRKDSNFSTQVPGAETQKIVT